MGNFCDQTPINNPLQLNSQLLASSKCNFLKSDTSRELKSNSSIQNTPPLDIAVLIDLIPEISNTNVLKAFEKYQNEGNENMKPFPELEKLGPYKYLNENGNVYIGQYNGGRREGLGTQYYADGSIYEGMWASDLPQSFFIHIFG